MYMIVQEIVVTSLGIQSKCVTYAHLNDMYVHMCCKCVAKDSLHNTLKCYAVCLHCNKPKQPAGLVPLKFEIQIQYKYVSTVSCMLDTCC
jgi:hypothetical protein